MLNDTRPVVEVGSAARLVPNVPLNDGNSIPMLGLGVWLISNEAVVRVTAEAIRAGYRSIDTAQGYDNEEGVGRAIREAEIDRAELFIASKLSTRSMGFDQALRGCEQSLGTLGLEQLDMFLIHWPMPKLDRYVETWQALVRLREEGRVRTIGVSNFLPEHLIRIIDATGAVPALNQIEIHPGYQQRAVRAFHEAHNIQLESYSPLAHGEMLDDPVIGRIAKKHGKSPAQVILRWHLQEGLVAIPKSSHEERVRENLDVFDFELDEEDLMQIVTLDDPEHGKTGSKPEEFNEPG
jgi:2,5-diketo-D-gluconate reductase A